MSLKKVKAGSNMYQFWITHTHSLLGGRCPHLCSYCYVESNKRSPIFVERYRGEIRLIEKEFNSFYGKGKTIFVEHCNDLFAKNVPDEFICRVLNHCSRFPENTYVFQTKNPARYSGFLHLMPRNATNAILGATIETNRDMSDVSKAPPARERYEAMKSLRQRGFRTFITIEPILDFCVDEFSRWIGEINPEFINIGADSKGHNLVEPTYSKIVEFTNILRDKYGIKIIVKHNMQRLIDKENNQ